MTLELHGPRAFNQFKGKLIIHLLRSDKKGNLLYAKKNSDTSQPVTISGKQRIPVFGDFRPQSAKEQP